MAGECVPNFTIRLIKEEEVSQLQAISERQGWNESKEQLLVTYRQFPEGQFGAFDEDGQLLSFCGGEIFDEELAFLSSYITRQENRRQGIGSRVFKTLMESFGDRNVIVNAAYVRTAMYIQIGFKYESFVIGYNRGIPKPASPIQSLPSLKFQSIDDVPIEELKSYDEGINPSRSLQFLQSWLGMCECAIVAIIEGNIVGYAGVVKAPDNHKIWPLYADHFDIAANLVTEISSRLPAESEMELIVPSNNPDAIRLAQFFSLEQYYRNSRLYTKELIDLPTAKVFSLFNPVNSLL